MTAYLFLAPVLVFAFGLYVCWSRVAAGKTWLRGWGLLAMWACYLSTGALLVLGGCKRIAHVRLEGVEMALTESHGKNRLLSVGAAPAAAQAAKVPAPAIEVDGYPVDAFRIKLGDKALRIEPGSGWRPGLLVRSGGHLVPMGGLPRLVPLQDGDEILLEDASVPTSAAMPGAAGNPVDPLVGTMTWRKGTLAWKGQERTSRFVLRSDAQLSAGGGLADDLFIQGLAAGALELEVREGKLVLRNVGKVPGVPKEWQGIEGKALRIGGENSPWAGRLGVVKVREVEKSVAESNDDSAESDPVAPAKVWEIVCRWDTAAETKWVLPKRKVILPVIKKEVEVFSHLKWTDRVYPLSALGGRQSKFMSCVVYGAPGLGVNEAGLLILDKGVTVQRGGKVLEAAKQQDGVLAQNEALEFLEIKTQSRKASGQRAMQASEVIESRAVQTVRRLGVVTLEQTGTGQQPQLRITFAKPEVKAVPLGEIKRDLKDNIDADGKIAFGINERHEFATLPHQVKFSRLWPWFSRATGEVEMHWLGLTVQDDYRRQELDFGEVFTIGGKDRLRVKVEKMGVPWTSLVWVGAAMLLASLAAWPWLQSPAGTGLFFGVSFLTCSRGLFGHAVWVNAPYDPQVAEVAWKVAVFLPLLVSAFWWLGGRLKQGAPGRLLDWCMRRGLVFCAVAAGCLLLARLLLLMGGFKEGLPLGGSRLALSVVFVPAHLLLQAAVLLRLQQEVEGGSLKLIWRAALCLAWIFGCEILAGLAVSDLGSFLYLMPAMLVLVVLAGRGVLRGVRDGSEMMESWGKMVKWFGSCAALAMPALVLMCVLVWPKTVMQMVAGDLNSKIAKEEEIVTDSTLLRILHFADENYLINFGTDASETILQDHAIMENYAERGLSGAGFLGVRVIPAKQVTAMNDNVSAVYLLGQFGFLGALAACGGYLAILLAGTGGPGKGNILAFLSAATFSLVSLYMLAANAGVLPFTGRNMYLWGLNSLSDVLESFLMLGLLVFALSPACKPLTPAECLEFTPEAP